MISEEPPLVLPSRNRYAIASLALSVCGGTVISLVLGIVALGKIKRTGEKGRGLAIAGIVISSLWLAGLGVVFVLSRLEAAQRNAAGLISEGGQFGVFELRAGDCLPAVPDGGVDNLFVTPCAEPHEAEVFAIYTFPGPVYPGDDELDDLAFRACSDELSSYSLAAAEDTSTLITTFLPTRDSWDSGERRVVCMALFEPLRLGSIKDR
jgi:hypothetical protein